MSNRISTKLRLMTADDLPMVFSWRNHSEVKRYMQTQHEIQFDEHQSWFERCATDKNKHLFIFENMGEACGFVSLQMSEGLVAEWGFYVSPDAVKGTGTKMGVCFLDYAFNELKLHKVFAKVLDFNERSIGLHKKLGFFQEGNLVDQYFDGKKYHSVLYFGKFSA